MEKASAAVGRVLIVDDEADNRFIIGELIKKRLHCEVVLAESVVDALEHYDAEKFDVIISDYEMPTRTGLDFAGELSKRHCDIPFLIYTAYDIPPLEPRSWRASQNVRR